MSRGLGWVQRACLLVIDEYEQDGYEQIGGNPPTTYNITASVFQVKPDEDGYRLVSDAQHVAVKRALENLQQKGRVIGFRGHWPRSRDDGRAELCHHWMTERGLKRFLAEQIAHIKQTRQMGFNPEGTVRLMTAVMHKAKTIGMRNLISPPTTEA
jgi:hypothetical protein